MCGFGGVVAGVAVLLILIHIVGSVVGEMVCWWIDKSVITVVALRWTGRGSVIVVEAEEIRLLVCHGGAERW